MPTDTSILGFENRWQAEAVPFAVSCELPSGRSIAAVPPPFLLATKLEAFASRGNADYVGSRDMADVVSLLDGWAELADEVVDGPDELRNYVVGELAHHRVHPRFGSHHRGFDPRLDVVDTLAVRAARARAPVR